MLLRIAPILLALLLPSFLRAQGGSPGTGGGPSQRQIDGRALAQEVMNAYGGQKVWNDPAWNLSFDFVVMRDGKEAARFSHQWIRSSNYYTVSGITREGKPWRAIFTNIWDRKGTATIDGKSVHDTLLPKMLENGYGRFINDTYWFLMPFKLLDSGVYHRREADTAIDGKTYNVLNLSFGNVGLTPGDRYWLYIDPATKLVARWRYLLQGGNAAEYIWDQNTSYGPMTLALRRKRVDGDGEIRFEKVRVEGAGYSSKRGG